jgi:hypothetical protein
MSTGKWIVVMVLSALGLIVVIGMRDAPDRASTESPAPAAKAWPAKAS